MDNFSRRGVGKMAVGTWLLAMMAATTPSVLAQTPAANAAKMEKRKLGSMNCSLTGVGLVTLGRDGDYPAAERLIHAALDNGINFFDSSNIYGNTPQGTYNADLFLGRALGGRRDKAYIATKLGYDSNSGSTAMPPPYKGLSEKAVMEQLEQSLKTLGTDYIDLYQVHRNDPNVPIEETLGAFAKAIQQGKVRHIGQSSANPDQLRAHDAAARKLGVPRFIGTQATLSLLSRGATTRLLPTLQELGIGLIPITPLANGFLTGKYRPDEPPPAGAALSAPQVAARMLTEKNFKIILALEAWAKDHGHTMLDLAFAWVAAQPQVISIIAGARNVEQVTQNAAATQWKLTPTQTDEVARLAASFDSSVLPPDENAAPPRPRPERG